MNCINESVNVQAKRYIELSSGCINSSEKTPLREDCKTDPWTAVAKQKLKVEKELQSMENFSYTIVRLPIVYGIGDKRYLSKYFPLFIYSRNQINKTTCCICIGGNYHTLYYKFGKLN